MVRWFTIEDFCYTTNATFVKMIGKAVDNGLRFPLVAPK
jgi:hypothetical protein